MSKKRSFFCTLIVLFLLLSISYSLFLTYDNTPLTKRSDAIYILSSDKNSVVSSLQKSGVTLNKVDKFLLEYIDLPTEGWYRVDISNRSRLHFFTNLHKNRASTMTIVVYAGDTVQEIFERLAKNMGLNADNFLGYYEKYSQFLEAEILADKYIVAKDADEDVIVRYLLDQCAIELDFFAKERFGSSYTKDQLHEALIMASIIHKESNKLSEMSTIASVINNRLKKGMKLQMDGTLCYGKYSRTVVTPERIKNDNSHFNTYKYKGLPPYPICTVSMDALEAATFPRESDYLYFMLNRNGSHDFATNYKEHRQNIKRFKNSRRKPKTEKLKDIKGDPKSKDYKSIKKIEIKDSKNKKSEKQQEKKPITTKVQEKKVKKETTKDSVEIVEDQKTVTAEVNTKSEVTIKQEDNSSTSKSDDKVTVDLDIITTEDKSQVDVVQALSNEGNDTNESDDNDSYLSVF